MRLRDLFAVWGKKEDKVYMVMQCKRGRDIEWVTKENDENGEPLMRRTPQPVRVEYKMDEGFVAAGRRYKTVMQLDFGKVQGESEYLHRDAYGRKMLHFKERYPCFDSFDYMTEDRYYHWCLFKVDDRLTSVYYGDDSNWGEVVEDVGSVREKWAEEMKKIGWVI